MKKQEEDDFSFARELRDREKRLQALEEQLEQKARFDSFCRRNCRQSILRFDLIYNICSKCLDRIFHSMAYVGGWTYATFLYNWNK